MVFSSPLSISCVTLREHPWTGGSISSSYLSCLDEGENFLILISYLTSALTTSLGLSVLFISVPWLWSARYCPQNGSKRERNLKLYCYQSQCLMGMVTKRKKKKNTQRPTQTDNNHRTPSESRSALCAGASPNFQQCMSVRLCARVVCSCNFPCRSLITARVIHARGLLRGRETPTSVLLLSGSWFGNYQPCRRPRSQCGAQGVVLVRFECWWCGVHYVVSAQHHSRREITDGSGSGLRSAQPDYVCAIGCYVKHQNP